MNTMHILDPQQRLAARQRGESRMAVSLVQLLCAVSVLRTGLTRVLPLAGGAAWWSLGVCLLPGAAVFLLAWTAMRIAGAETLPELLHCAVGRGGAWTVSWVLAALLLLDAAASLTAIVTLFTEGIGTRGTQLTLALLTGGALMACLHREGLPRGTHLLCRGLLIAAAVVAAAQLRHVRVDNLFPLMGGGMGDAAASLRRGVSAAWPLLLLLCLPGASQPRRLQEAIPAALAPAAVLLLIALIVPHERIVEQGMLAQSLQLPARYAPTAVRLLWHCAVLLAFFLAVGGALQWGTQLLCAPVTRAPAWLPWAALVLVTATQALDTAALWRFLGAVGIWALLPPAVIIVPCAAAVIVRRERP